MFNWLDQLASWLVFEVFKLSEGSRSAEALHFFFYDTVKILILLFIVIFLMGIVNSFFPVQKVRNYLSRNKLFGFEYLMASLFGVVTPFCSCSSVPLFIGFVRGGIPLGVTFAFLITSPLVNEVAIGLFIGLFGLKVTAVYLISGVILGTVSGIVLQKLRLERLLTPWVKEVLENAEREQNKFEDEKVQLIQRLPIIWHEVLSILRGVIPYVIVGIAIGALMHGYIPSGFFEAYMSKENIWAVPLATVLAIPMYSNASGILPIVQVLVAKGIPIGTAMAFMMGVVGLSLPEAMLLKKVMTFKLIAIFFAVVAVCIIISGYLFNMIF